MAVYLQVLCVWRSCLPEQNVSISSLFHFDYNMKTNCIRAGIDTQVAPLKAQVNFGDFDCERDCTIV